MIDNKEASEQKKYKGAEKDPVLHKEPLIYENIKVAQRNYKK